jgi:hypothetical protein
MHRVTPAGRGPNGLFLVARLQLAAILAYSVMLAGIGWMVYFADWSGLECFDGTEPACTEPEPPFPLARFLVQSTAWALVIVAGVVAVWRRTLAALALPAVAALAANRIAEIPLPF